MKRLILTFFFTQLSFLFYAQNGVYMVTEVYLYNSSLTEIQYDSVYVTNPSGVTSGYSLPLFTQNIVAHNSQFNTILNGITSLGYKIVTTDWQHALTTPTISNQKFFKTVFLAQP